MAELLVGENKTKLTLDGVNNWEDQLWLNFHDAENKKVYVTLTDYEMLQLVSGGALALKKTFEKNNLPGSKPRKKRAAGITEAQDEVK